MDAQPSLEYRLAKLLADYFSSIQQQGGLSAQLNIAIGMEVAARNRPCVVFHIDTLEFPHAKLAAAEGQMILFTHADQTNVLQEAVLVAALRTILSNLGGFFAWMAALPEDQRTGWDIRRLRITRCEHEISREERIRTHTTRFVISAHSSELASVA